MSNYKIYLTLSALIVSATSANFNGDRFDAISQRIHEFGKPYSNSPSDAFSSSTDYRPTAIRRDFEGESRFASSEEDFFTSGTKKIPREDKSFKKKVYPYYTITEKDTANYKGTVLKSGLPYCQEIKSKEPTRNSKEGKGITICQKCKDPKTGANYEQCSYSSRPESSSSEIREFVPPPIFRSRRSNPESRSTYSKSENTFERSPYRFSDEVFADSSRDVLAKYKKKDEKCEKFVKDTMICMLCEDIKTGSKYEQCSYVGKPTEKAYSYSKSSSFGKPKGMEYSEKYKTSPSALTKLSSDSEKESEASQQNQCRKVKRDSKVCMICKDSKTGENYEKCSYDFRPNDKIYEYSKSKSFGYPSKDSPEELSTESVDNTRETSTDYKSDYSIPEEGSFYGEDSTVEAESISPSRSEDVLENYKSESEKAAENINLSSCDKVEKDGMTCTICKDPKGGNFEQCSYSYRPNDKLFSYSKSRSFGDAKEKDSENEEGEENHPGKTYFVSESIQDETSEKRNVRENEKETPNTDFFNARKKKAEIERFLQEFQKEDRSNCKKINRDKMTCYRCIDDKGFQKEECVFVGDEKSAEDRSEYREIGETARPPRQTVILEPEMSGSENHYVKREKPDNEYSVEKAEDEEETKEAEPYDYTSETRTRYDKVLGLSLPEYMLTRSEHEAEFDEIVASSRI